MGNIPECSCQPKQQNNQNNLQIISKNLQAYAYKNYLMQFDKPTRQIIQKLFVLNQSHVGDRLMSLIVNKNQQQKNVMLKDLLRINLQQFDEICHCSSKNLHNYQKTQHQVNLVKMSQKYLGEGEKCLKEMKILFVVTAECFGNQEINILQKTDLLSRKSRLQLFFQKIQAIKAKYNSNCQLYVICPQQFSSTYLNVVKQKGQVIAFIPNLPCFSYKNKIKLYGNRIQFNQNQGDLIYLLISLPTFKNLHQKFDYINFCDLSNYASPAINPIHLGYINSHNINILATIKFKPNTSPIIPTKNNFIEPTNLQFSDILLKTQIIQSIKTNKNDLHQLLNIRIERKLMNQSSDCYFFSRLPHDILYINWTHITKVPYFSQNRFQYSNLCKSVLGIQNENEEDMVQISPNILHGQSKQLSQIRDTIKSKAKEFSFPIIITKTKQLQ